MINWQWEGIVTAKYLLPSCYQNCTTIVRPVVLSQRLNDEGKIAGTKTETVRK